MKRLLGHRISQLDARKLAVLHFVPVRALYNTIRHSAECIASPCNRWPEHVSLEFLGRTEAISALLFFAGDVLSSQLLPCEQLLLLLLGQDLMLGH